MEPITHNTRESGHVCRKNPNRPFELTITYDKGIPVFMLHMYCLAKPSRRAQGKIILERLGTQCKANNTRQFLWNREQTAIIRPAIRLI